MATAIAAEVQFRACAGESQGFGATPAEALSDLLGKLSSESLPIVIWPFNQGDRFFGEAQQTRLKELKARREELSPAERDELERLIEASFDATIARTQAMPKR